MRALPRPTVGPAAIAHLAINPAGTRVWAVQYLTAIGAYSLDGRLEVVIPLRGEATKDLLAHPDGSLWLTQYAETNHYDARGRWLARWRHPTVVGRLGVAATSRPLLLSGRAAYALKPSGHLTEVLRWLPPGEEKSMAVAGHDSTFVVLFKEQLYHVALGRRPRMLGCQPVPVAAITRLAVDTAGMWWCFGTRQHGAVR
ncbi:MAG: hypothetical protein H7330_11940, partial [Hymenobacteraceae bacterium]|nr:hypothetical protein [Hymenobacteraceae bacterium]